MIPRVKSGRLRIDDIRTSFAANRIGARVEFVETTSSTNDLARSRSKDPDTDGLVVLTDYQSAGRGRLGRSWHSPRGASLLCSVVLREESPDWHGGQLALLAGIAAHDAVMHVNLGLLLNRQKHRDEALKELRIALQIDPNSTETRRVLESILKSN
ncbi:MAG: hypothetical protein IH892_12580 [Planctomycetes bacterium]|nr:hypothetical protein [Planctomycetota bacterium]